MIHRLIAGCVSVALLSATAGCAPSAEDSSEGPETYSATIEADEAAAETQESMAEGAEAAESVTAAMPDAIEYNGEDTLAVEIPDVEAAIEGTGDAPVAEEFTGPDDESRRGNSDAEPVETGQAVLAAPETMDIGQRYTVTLFVGTNDRVPDIVEAAESVGNVTQSGELQLAPYVCGELTAADFDVTEDLRQCQDRGASRQVSFDWQVSPTTDRPLTLRAKAITYDTEGGRPVDQRDSQTLQIAVNASGFYKFNAWASEMTESMGGLRNLLLALFAVLGVLSAIIWRVRKMGQKPDDTAMDPPAGG